jgi:hypothetical protein
MMLRWWQLPLLLTLTACVDRPLPNTGSALADGGAMGDLAMSKTDMSGVVFDMKGVIVDLAKPPDFGGVACGSITCNLTSQECCFSASGTATCVTKGTCNRDMAASLSCDGPEDCGGVSSLCCATISSGGGSAMCSATCPGSASMGAGGSFNATTKLCHTKDNCVGYNGSAAGTTLPFTSCCKIAQAPGLTFCAPAIITMFGGSCL